MLLRVSYCIYDFPRLEPRLLSPLDLQNHLILLKKDVNDSVTYLLFKLVSPIALCPDIRNLNEFEVRNKRQQQPV